MVPLTPLHPYFAAVADQGAPEHQQYNNGDDAFAFDDAYLPMMVLDDDNTLENPKNKAQNPELQASPMTKPWKTKERQNPEAQTTKSNTVTSTQRSARSAPVQPQPGAARTQTNNRFRTAMDLPYSNKSYFLPSASSSPTRISLRAHHDAGCRPTQASRNMGDSRRRPC
jgi:hypothetical protein